MTPDTSTQSFDEAVEELLPILESIKGVKGVVEHARALEADAERCERELSELVSTMSASVKTEAEQRLAALRQRAGDLELDLRRLDGQPVEHEGNGEAALEPPPEAEPPEAEPPEAEPPEAEPPPEPTPPTRRNGGKQPGRRASRPGRSKRNGAGDHERARLVALNMALSRTPREDTAAHLDEHFGVEGVDAILDEVYASAGEAES